MKSQLFNRFSQIFFFLSLAVTSAHAQDLIPYQLGDFYGFKDKTTGEIVIKAIYDNVAPYSEGLAYAQRQEKKFFIDKTGKIKINLQQYDSAYSFSEGLAVVKKDT